MPPVQGGKKVQPMPPLEADIKVKEGKGLTQQTFAGLADVLKMS